MCAPMTFYRRRYRLSLCCVFVFFLARTANFQLPEDNVLFDQVEFIELQRDEAQPLVEKYNKEGRAAQPPDSKRFRGNDGRYSSGSRFSMLNFWCRDFCVAYVHLPKFEALPTLHKYQFIPLSD